MILLLFIALLYTAAWVTAYFSWMLDNWYDSRMIFENWIPFLQETIGEDNFWYKPLGGCVKCANVWHAFITYGIALFIMCMYQELRVLIADFGFMHIALLIAYIAVTNGILRKKLLNE